MYILGLVDFNEIGYNMMVGIYSFLAKVYQILIDLAAKTNFGELLKEDIASYLDPIYVLAGVFMLFRLGVSFLNYLIDPDKVSDSQTGAGKMLTRVITSILLLMLLSPDGVVYKYLSDLETAILKSGVLEKITGQNVTTAFHFNPISYISTPVEAKEDSNGIQTCYYYAANTRTGNTFKIDKYYKLKISKNKFSGSQKVEYKWGIWDIMNGTMYAKLESGSETTSGGNKVNFTSGSYTIESSKYSQNHYKYDKNKCPAAILPQNANNILGLYSSSSGLGTGVGLGGYASLDKMISGIGQKNVSTEKEGYNYDYNSNDKGLSKEIEDAEDGARNNSSTLGVKSSGAINFTRAIGASFLNCTSGRNEEVGEDGEKCGDILDKMFTVDGDKNIVELINADGQITFSFLPSILVGIIVIVFVIILCVDVVVRSFKLLLLKILAPIPIINHIDPKDKMFDSWLKMFLSTYADLFIKLIAINFGISLLKLAIEGFVDGGLLRIFYVLGVLVFMKAVPDMISNIFGIKLASGTIKESMNMFKKGAMISSGSALGAAMGAATGKGFGRITGAISGAFMGAGSGMKNNITGGAKMVAEQNQRIATAKQQGLNIWDRTTASMASKIGMPSKGKDAVEQLKRLDDISSKNKNLKDWLEGEAVKKNVIVEDFTYKDSKGRDVKWSEGIGKGRGPIGVGTLQAELERIQAMDTSTIQNNALVANASTIQRMEGKLNALRTLDTSSMSSQELTAHNQKITEAETELTQFRTEVMQKAVYDHDIRVAETKSALAKAKTVGAAIHANNNADDIEVQTMISKVNDAIEEARLAGINVASLGINEMKAETMGEGTIKGIKNKVLEAQKDIGATAEKEIAKERYGNTSK